METKLARLTPEFVKPILRPLYRGYLRLLKIKRNRALRAQSLTVLQELVKKPILRPLYRGYLRLLKIRRDRALRPRSRAVLHAYWENPWDEGNLPEHYLTPVVRSEFLVQLVQKYISPDAKILEIGCNIGRNLNYLFDAGFKNLQAIEISEAAIKLLRESFPKMASQTEIYNMPVEDVIEHLGQNQYDLVFTMAVLEHIHPKSEWIFPEIVRISKEYLITIEDERTKNWRVIPRDYGRVFEALGMSQVEQVNCSKQKEGFHSGFVARVFRKTA